MNSQQTTMQVGAAGLSADPARAIKALIAEAGYLPVAPQAGIDVASSLMKGNKALFRETDCWQRVLVSRGALVVSSYQSREGASFNASAAEISSRAAQVQVAAVGGT